MKYNMPLVASRDAQQEETAAALPPWPLLDPALLKARKETQQHWFSIPLF